MVTLPDKAAVNKHLCFSSSEGYKTDWWIVLVVLSPPKVHSGIACDGDDCPCGRSALLGERFCCLECDNFDLCKVCYEKGTLIVKMIVSKFLYVWYCQIPQVMHWVSCYAMETTSASALVFLAVLGQWMMSMQNLLTPFVAMLSFIFLMFFCSFWPAARRLTFFLELFVKMILCAWIIFACLFSFSRQRARLFVDMYLDTQLCCFLVLHRALVSMSLPLPVTLWQRGGTCLQIFHGFPLKWKSLDLQCRSYFSELGRAQASGFCNCSILLFPRSIP